MTLSLSAHGLNLSMRHAAAQERDSAASNGRAERLTRFLTKTNRLMQEIEWLTTQPGWPEMVQIIHRAFSAPDHDERDALSRQIQIELDAWSRTWRTNAHAVYNRYLALAKRSRALEAQRLVLLEEWERLRQGLLRVVMWLVVQGEEKAEASTELLKLVVRLDQERREILGRYALDALDLFHQQ
jgi:hypothetical protein